MNFAALLEDIRQVEAEEAADEALAMAQVECIHEYSDGRGGGRNRYVGASYDAVRAAARAAVAAIDPYRSPSILSGPCQLPGGSWSATVGWYGLGD